MITKIAADLLDDRIQTILTEMETLPDHPELQEIRFLLLQMLEITDRRLRQWRPGDLLPERSDFDSDADR